MKDALRMPGATIHSHPLIDHKITLMRERDCSPSKFRYLTREIAMFLTYQATRDLPLGSKLIKLADSARSMQQPIIKAKKSVVVPILRAGLVLGEGALEVMPDAHVGHLGFERRDDYSVAMYLAVLPEPEDRTFFLYDAVIGTGNTACAAIDVLKKVALVEGDHIHFLTILITPEGENKITSEHPDVTVHAASRETGLDRNQHIVPGFGDASNRLFGIE